MKTQDFTATKFIGQWRACVFVFYFDWIFLDNSSFFAKCYLLGIPLYCVTGTWSIDGDKLVSIYNKHPYIIPNGLEDTDTLLEVAQDYFILVTKQGTRRRWKRVYDKPVA